MPTYLNNSSQPIYFNNKVFIPNQEVQTFDTLENAAFIVGTVLETYNIVFGVNDKLIIRFNYETANTTVTLTPGAAQAATDIATDINTAYGYTVASSEGGKVRIDCPIRSNTVTAIGIATTGSTAAVTLGLATADVNPVAVVCNQGFKFSTNAETYNITANNNTFIFKVNNQLDWIIATLTIGAVQTAQNIADDINLAYIQATADATKICYAETPVTAGPTYVMLLAPVYNNFQSKLFIKSTGNTALTVLGFTGDNFQPISTALYPSLVKTSELPLHNPMISETIVTFGAASTQHYYLTDADKCKELIISRVTGGGGIKFTVYLEDATNTPPYTLVVLDSIVVDLRNIRVTKLIITSNMAGTITIREMES